MHCGILLTVELNDLGSLITPRRFQLVTINRLQTTLENCSRYSMIEQQVGGSCADLSITTVDDIALLTVDLTKTAS